MYTSFWEAKIIDHVVCERKQFSNILLGILNVIPSKPIHMAQQIIKSFSYRITILVPYMLTLLQSLLFFILVCFIILAIVLSKIRSHESYSLLVNYVLYKIPTCKNLFTSNGTWTNGIPWLLFMADIGNAGFPVEMISIAMTTAVMNWQAWQLVGTRELGIL